MKKVKTELYYYDIYPKVLPINKMTTITIRSLTLNTNFNPESNYRIAIVSINGGCNSTGTPPLSFNKPTSTNLTLSFTYQFESEQEYHIRIYKDETLLSTLSVYALEPDLMNRIPLVGDFHVHSCLSDGKEGPEFVAAKYRQEGFDFTSITDHNKYDPSIRAINAYEDVELDYRLYPGEEIHSPKNNVHLVSFGCDHAINPSYLEDGEFDWWEKSSGKSTWYDEVDALQKTLQDIPEGIHPCFLPFSN